MSFDSAEKSLDQGEPINVYKFIYGPDDVLDVLAYTDAEQPLVFADVEGQPRVYYPRPIQRGDIQSSGTTDKSTLEISMPSNDPVAEMFRVYPPSYPVSVFIWSGHVDQDDFALQWSGKVLSCSRDGALEASLTCEPITVSLQRIGLRRHWQYMCGHVLYSQGYGRCNANKAAATTEVTAGVVLGRDVYLTGALLNAGHYAGGILEWVNEDGRNEYRTILAVALVEGKTKFTLSGIAREIEIGEPIKAIKGCAHNGEACVAVHNNINNFGGQPYIPTKNPLGRSSPFL